MFKNIRNKIVQTREAIRDYNLDKKLARAEGSRLKCTEILVAYAHRSSMISPVTKALIDQIESGNFVQFPVPLDTRNTDILLVSNEELWFEEVGEVFRPGVYMYSELSPFSIEITACRGEEGLDGFALEGVQLYRTAVEKLLVFQAITGAIRAGTIDV